MQEFKLGMNLPGELLLTAIFNYAAAVRNTMSQENRDRFDSLNIQAFEDCRRLWIKLGVIPQ